MDEISSAKVEMESTEKENPELVTPYWETCNDKYDVQDGYCTKKIKTKRNDFCYCGSGKKFKFCCLGS